METAMPGTVLATADVLIGGSVIVGIGPGLLTAAGDDEMIVVQCGGCVIMPTHVVLSGGGRLTPGRQADIAVYRLAGTSDSPATAQQRTVMLRLSAGRIRC
jgi:imidazolonepropionase-like amidohydrolase